MPATTNAPTRTRVALLPPVSVRSVSVTWLVDRPGIHRTPSARLADEVMARHATNVNPTAALTASAGLHGTFRPNANNDNNWAPIVSNGQFVGEVGEHRQHAVPDPPPPSLAR